MTSDEGEQAMTSNEAIKELVKIGLGAGVFAEWIARQFEGGDRIFLWSNMIRGVMPRGISGRIAVTRQAFLNAGGYSEKYDTWGPDDKDFNARLRRLGYGGREIEPMFLMEGVRHNDRLRFREYPEVKHSACEETFTIDADTTIANFGKFGEGIVYRNFDLFNGLFEPIQLYPLPTRIFGIGMHKTATTSLHTALTRLGLDSAHWKNAHWAKAIYNEMTTVGRSATLEKNYALCDLPIPLLFRKLDRAYPGSKFILTVRDEAKWLQAVRDHWSYDYNIYRKSWDTDPFTHRLHTLLYGQRGFDAELFLARYRRHNAEVLEYFRDRQDDLTVMNVDAGDGWPSLCKLLRQQIPAEPYPNIDPVVRG
jgi:hypothetical protein